MSVLETVQDWLSGDDGDGSIREYECTDCGNTFESAKTPEKAKCMECLSLETTVRE